MSEGFVPQEARGFTAPGVENRTVLSALREKAADAWKSLAVALTIFSAAEAGAVDAPPVKDQGAETKKDFTQEKFKRETPHGTVTYVQRMHDQAEIAGVSGKETSTAIVIVDQGDPNVQGDEFTVEGKFLHFVGVDQSEEWVQQIGAEGTVKAEKNPFGRVNGFPAWLGKTDSPGLEVARVNSEFLKCFELLQVYRAFKDTEKGETPEAGHVLGDLQKRVRGLEERFPGIPVDPDLRAEVMDSAAK